ncbi:MAG: GxxExxY protein [Patescibacteria group bacterium]
MRMGENEKVIYKELSYTLNGILFAVHNELGRFRSEKEYCDCIEKHLNDLLVNYEREKALPPSFEGELARRNIVDFLIQDKIILEVKAKRILERVDYYQVKRYSSALNKKLAVLVNFQQKYLTPKRILNSFASE